MDEMINRLRSYEPLWDDRKIDSFIAKGASSYVYKLKKQLPDNTTEYTAVKVISISIEDEKELNNEAKLRSVFDKRFNAENEIFNMNRLNDCPYIVKCEDYLINDICDKDGSVKGFDILIHMNYYTTLSNYLTDNDLKLTEEDILKLAKHIGIALKTAHDNSIIHRDIKPDNIFLDKESNFLLGDMGVSKEISNNTSFYTIAGTEPYVAPEQLKIQNTNKNYKASDIYSFGIVLYTLLNDNYLPFVDANSSLPDIQKAINRRLAGENLPPPKNGSDKLRQIVLKCCKYDSKNRYQDMNEFLYDLYEITGDDISTLDLSHKSQRSKSIKKLTATAIILLAVMSMITAAYLITSARQSKKTTDIVTSTKITTTTIAAPKPTSTSKSTKKTSKITKKSTTTKKTTTETESYVTSQYTAYQTNYTTTNKSNNAANQNYANTTARRSATKANSYTTANTRTNNYNTTQATASPAPAATTQATEQHLIIENKESIAEVI